MERVAGSNLYIAWIHAETRFSCHLMSFIVTNITSLVTGMFACNNQFTVEPHFISVDHCRLISVIYVYSFINFLNLF